MTEAEERARHKARMLQIAAETSRDDRKDAYLGRYHKRRKPTGAEQSLERMEARVRDLYVNGAIEVEEFEQRIDRILRGRPMPVDTRRSLDDLRFGPGVAIPTNGRPYLR